MALLLRMGGVPARVASGFSPGIVNTERNEYVVRDVDAHSWVEYWAPGIGWVTRDPTPADAPARAQAADLAAGAATIRSRSRAASARWATRPTPAAPRRRRAPRRRTTGRARSCSPRGGLLALGGRRWPPSLRVAPAPPAPAPAPATPTPSSPSCAARCARSGREPPADLTLEQLAARLAGTPAHGYVRTLADARFGYGDGRPTRAQRAALRRELGAGLGARGRLRAWWALPPR